MQLKDTGIVDEPVEVAEPLPKTAVSVPEPEASVETKGVDCAALVAPVVMLA